MSNYNLGYYQAQYQATNKYIIVKRGHLVSFGTEDEE